LCPDIKLLESTDTMTFRAKYGNYKRIIKCLFRKHFKI